MNILFSMKDDTIIIPVRRQHFMNNNRSISPAGFTSAILLLGIVFGASGICSSIGDIGDTSAILSGGSVVTVSMAG